MRKINPLLAVLVLLVCFLLLPNNVQAAEIVEGGSCGDNVSWTLDDAGHVTISGTGPMKDYGYYRDQSPWRTESGIVSVRIEEGVTHIGAYSFDTCFDLAEVSLPDSLTSIGTAAFSSCYELTGVTIPKNVTSIGDTAFSSCVKLPAFEVAAGNSAFAVDEYGVLFNKDMSKVIQVPCLLTGTYVIPDTVNTIGYAAFSNCSIVGVIIPEGITAIPTYTFNLTGIMFVQIPASCTLIDSYAFNCRYYLKHIFYTGTEEQWAQIDISEYGNVALTDRPVRHDCAVDYDVKCIETANTNSYYCSICDDVFYVKVTGDGWVELDDKWYYYENGAKVTNAWKLDSVGWCYLTEDGIMATNQWILDSVGWCYVGANGYCLTNCWAQDSVGWIWLNSEGSMTKSAWIQDGGKWYYLDENGYMVSNQWRKDSKGWCWLTASGAMAANQWVKDSRGWCYIGANGYCWTNCWAKDSVGWVWLDSEGSMVYSKWIKDSGSWYYVGSNGYMLANTTFNGYRFNASGVCTNP